MNPPVVNWRQELRTAKKDVAAACAAGWIVPATVEIANLDLMYPALAGGVAYYVAVPSGYGIVYGYMAGGLVYGITMYQRLPDWEEDIDSLGGKIEQSAKDWIEARKSKVIAWILKQLGL